MIPIHQFVKEEKEAFVFKGTFQNHEVSVFLVKETGEVMINADDLSKIMGHQDFGNFLAQDEPMQNAFLDDMNGDFYEYSNAEMLLILQDINQIEDKSLRSSLISKLGIQ
jgi:hypothetical protein